MSNEVLLQAQDVKQYFTVKKERGQKATLYAVDGVTLSIYKGETFGLVGRDVENPPWAKLFCGSTLSPAAKSSLTARIFPACGARNSRSFGANPR